VARKKRIPKTLERKLRDLDDHLYLLTEFRRGLAAGETAYLKVLATDLRTLVCKSSGTEGLLWRLIDELGVSDEVHVHLPSDVDPNHPSNQSLSLRFAPIFRAGEDDTNLPPANHSLRRIIKECEGIYVSGNGYTHEKLIATFAQQMGSAHEDDGAEPHLVELVGVLIANLSLLTRILDSDADYVSEVGNRVLSSANESFGYCRKPRLRTIIEANSAIESQAEVGHFEEVIGDVGAEGTFYQLYVHSHPDWRSNNNNYSFDTIVKGSLSIEAKKHSDCTFEITITGITEQPLKIRQPVTQAATHNDVGVAFSWGAGEITGYMNGQEFHSNLAKK